MSTTLAKKETVERKWYVIDAAGKPLGRTAVTVANLLRGKTKPTFTPNVDCGDFVIVINTDKAILTGKKLEQKTYYRVTGWIGGLKETKARTMMENRSDYAMELAVKGMLPKNSIGRNSLTRLHLYKGEEHPHAAQSPKHGPCDLEVIDNVREQEEVLLRHRPSEVLRRPCPRL